MTHGLDDAIAQLEKLYNYGNELLDTLDNDFVKNSGLFEVVTYADRLVASPFASKEEKTLPPATIIKMDEFEKRVSEKTKAWSDKVTTKLNVVAPQARYRLSFNDIDLSVYSSNLLKPTAQGKRITNALAELKSRIKRLYSIIVDIEKSTQTAPTIQRASYDPVKRVLYFAGEEIGFYSNSVYPPEICRIMFANLSKEDWKLSDFFSLWNEDLNYITPSPKDWQRVQDVIRKLNQRIKKRTKISNLFILDSKSVHLNKNYIG